jgi:hypothetical protein
MSYEYLTGSGCSSFVTTCTLKVRPALFMHIFHCLHMASCCLAPPLPGGMARFGQHYFGVSYQVQLVMTWENALALAPVSRTRFTTPRDAAQDAAQEPQLRQQPSASELTWVIFLQVTLWQCR